MHGQEVGGVLKLGDQPQLVGKLAFHVRWQAAGEAKWDGRAHQPFQRFLRRLAGRLGLVRILVAQLGQAEGAAARDLQRARQRVGMARVQPRHLGRRLQVPVRKALAAEPGVVDGAALADAGDHVL